MAFWGTEVKPKKPFRLSFEDLEGGSLHLTQVDNNVALFSCHLRLSVSKFFDSRNNPHHNLQVTLGNISSNERTILKCKVGDKRAVFLCFLLPEVAETCSLNLYSSEEVFFLREWLYEHASGGMLRSY